jgi:hypothetical protein
MSQREEVVQFLNDFSFKLDFWGLYLRTDRTNDKNTKTLLSLELHHTHVRTILKSLQWEEYSEGPIPDNQYKISAMWVFGKIVKGHEVYIKIQLGNPSSEVICISFHFPDHKMNYPLKNYIL